MLARALATLLLTLWPITAWADHAEPRPVPIEVAGAMVPCLSAAAGGHVPAPAARMTAQGGNNEAMITMSDEVALHLIRAEPNPAWRQAGLAYSLDDDPIRPAMLLMTTSALRGEGPPLAPQAITCFEQEYRYLLRP